MKRFRTHWDKLAEEHRRERDRFRWEWVPMAEIHGLILLVVISLVMGGLPW